MEKKMNKKNDIVNTAKAGKDEQVKWVPFTAKVTEILTYKASQGDKNAIEFLDKMLGIKLA